MKISVSLEKRDVEYLDELAADGAYPSRSAAVAHAIRVLREIDLRAEYAQAYSREAEDLGWDSAAGDGLAPEKPWW